ncbi:uncharacterized protein BEWA_046430 [Theileria equi strain WA]|uniref:Membrane protein, putative n=1 Tax=Theileria equi strain WA TaxID=1537102 RepID=L1LA91_THEEQ|nr:uncharacterized protein BEWA_046430 [Theileria equi strain WA]EKX72179.1 membrane protein, putative [Theileria equi strain WA]|eukprot:XP_004831631.1 uncharacterized protein BEWA_046430 [Theileria equi strain WA]
MNSLKLIVLIQSLRLALCTRAEPADEEDTRAPGNLRQSSGFIKELTLDISRDDNPKVERTITYSGGTRTDDFHIPENFPVTLILDEHRTVWEGTLETPCTFVKLIHKSGEHKHLTITLGRGHRAGKHYFEKVDGEWSQISKKKNGSENDSEDTFTINIDARNDPRVSVKESAEGEVVHVVYRDLEGSRVALTSKVTSVISGPFTFWVKGQFDTFELCEEYYRNDKRLVVVRVNSLGLTKKLFFQITGYGWQSIEKDEFEEQLKSMRSNEEQDRIEKEFAKMLDRTMHTSLVLDLSNTDPVKVARDEEVREGVTEVSLRPIVGCIFSKVVDGGVTLWAGKGDEQCELVKLYAKGKRYAIFLQLSSASMYFRSAGDAWVKVPENDFEALLTTMRAEKETTSTSTSGFNGLGILPVFVLLFFWI